MNHSSTGADIVNDNVKLNPTIDDLLRGLTPLLDRVPRGNRFVKLRHDTRTQKTGETKCEHKPLTDAALRDHLSGKERYGVYPMSSGETTTCIALFDLDSHRGESTWAEMQAAMLRVMGHAERVGLRPIPFRSGGGSGGHIYLLWDAPQDAYSVRCAMRAVLDSAGFKEGNIGGIAAGNVEILPKQDVCSTTGVGFYLPLGGKSAPLDTFELDDMPRDWVTIMDWPTSDPVPVLERPAYAIRESEGEVIGLETLQRYAELLHSHGEKFDYDTIQRLNAAFYHVSAGDERAMHLFEHAILKFSGFDPAFTQYKWDSYGSGYSGATAGIGTIKTLAASFDQEAANDIELADMADDFEVELGEPISLYANYQGRPWGRLLQKNTNRKIPEPISNEANTAFILRAEPLFESLFAYNTFSDRVDVLRKNDFGLLVGEWKDGYDLILLEWFQRVGLQFNHTQVERAVNIVAAERAYNPVQDYLRGLAWDGKPRLDTWLRDYVGAEQTAYKRAVGSRWMIGAVARALRPGCKMDNVLLFEGAQGKFKSTVFDVLGGAWFQDTCPDIGKKDALENLRGAWVIEMGELSAMRAAEIEPMKAFIAARQDRYRPSYGRRAANYPRTCVFAGTTNGEKYLKDDENRRFWPVSVGAIDIPALRRDRDQLWAEAVHRFKAGEQWWLNAEETIDAVGEQAARKADDEWLPIIAAWLVNLGDDDDFAGVESHITNARIKTDALQIRIADLGRRDADKDGKRIGAVMKELGYHRGSQIRIHGVPDRPWVK